LDDSSDDLVIGLGSSLGTTTHIAIDEAGIVRMPLQPCFMLRGSSSETFTSSETNTVTFSSEIFDLNADVASVHTFTAPVTGKYLLAVRGGIHNTSSTDDNEYIIYIRTSNSDFNNYMGGDMGPTFGWGGTVVADMDANDTAYITIYDAGNSGANFSSGTDASFSGFLVA